MDTIRHARLSVHAAFVSRNEFGLNMLTPGRGLPADEMEIGENLLLISTGKDKSCTCATCGGGAAKKESIGMLEVRIDRSELRISRTSTCRRGTACI